MGGLRYRVAKLMAAGVKSDEAVILDTLPGMTRDEALRLWFGPDRSTWPPSGVTFIMLINGLELYALLEQPGDIPNDFMEHRDELLFDIRWKRLCDVFDDYRRQVQDKTGHGLMLRTTPHERSIYKAHYGSTDIPFEAPASTLN